MRYAIYWYPEADDPLLGAGEAWLGRRVGGEAVDAPPPGGVLSAERFADLTRSARRYGFHATLAPPLTLIDGVAEAQLLDAVKDLARGLVPVPMPRLEVAKLAGFIALRPVDGAAALSAIAARTLAAVDVFRHPPTADELARRKPETLSARARELLARWGYPYVLDAYRFHITLSDTVAGPEADALIAAARRHFATALDRSRRIDSLGLSIETHPGAPFRLLTRIGFGA